MKRRALLLTAFIGAGCVGCDGHATTDVERAGSAASGHGGFGACAVAYSCRTEMESAPFTCVESSVPPEAIRTACGGASFDGLSHVYSEAPCPREPSAFGCIVRESGRCQVSWFYGTVPGHTLAQQCSRQGHQPVQY